jgi:Zn-dependent membrane protease YugP
MVLKTEVKAQNRCLEILKEEGMVNNEEVGMMKELFKLYNIQYVNDIIMQLLEMILRILQLLAKVQSNSASSNN